MSVHKRLHDVVLSKAALYSASASCYLTSQKPTIHASSSKKRHLLHFSMSGITCGSVGDIIALGQIAWALASALTESRGSAKEYQQLAKELRSFDQALLQVVALWQNYDDSPELIELGKTTKELIQEWRDTLLAFRLKVDKKYGTSLAPGGSGKWMKDASKKILWLKEKEEVGDLRGKLQRASNTLLILTQAANGASSRLSSAAQAFRVELVHSLLAESLKRAEEHMVQLKILEEKIDSQANTSDKILTTVQRNVTFLAKVPLIAIDMKHLLSLFHSHIASQQATPYGLGTHWQQAPATLEDALGFMIPIPLELVNSWEMFEMIIAKRFEKHPGHGKIQNREYSVEDSHTGSELNRASEWGISIRPGQKIDMSVLFPDVGGEGNYCPRCSTKSTASTETRTQCDACHMWFQRLVEVEDSDDYFQVGATPAILRESQREPSSPAIGPGDFQRVRLMMRKIGSKEEHTRLHRTKATRGRQRGLTAAEKKQAREDRDAGRHLLPTQTGRQRGLAAVEKKQARDAWEAKATVSDGNSDEDDFEYVDYVVDGVDYGRYRDAATLGDSAQTSSQIIPLLMPTTDPPDEWLHRLT